MAVLFADVRILCAMTMRSDHKALVFIGAIAVLGAGVRVVRASTAAAPTTQPALERQMQAADSSARAVHTPRQQGRKAAVRSAADTTKRKLAPDTSKRRFGSGPLDRPGYIAGKLDLDVATAAQIDSLPGVPPSMAKRIVIDRMIRGPFLSRDGLRRVFGVGPSFIQSIDSLITFSGTIVQPNASDTIIVRRAAVRVRKP